MPVPRLGALVVVGLLAGCEKGEPVAWVEGFGYGWTGFNHRLSHLEYAVDGDEAVVAVVGGTSTTNVDAVLPDTCDPDTCIELAFVDSADVDLRWVRFQPRSERTGRAHAELVADADGETTTVEVPLDRKARGEVVAVIGGLVIDTDHDARSGPACYDPAYGWHPRRIAVALGDPRLDDTGHNALVDVTATFEAGLSLEPERACVDAIAADALVPITVEVVVVAGRSLETDVQDVEFAETYGWGCEDVSGPCLEPDPQPDPLAEERPLHLDLDSAVAGWSAVDFAFFADDPDGRGAYLRTLSVAFDPDEGWASGHATNYSPITQLSGFEYAFSGEIRSVGVSEAPERGRVRDNLSTDVDAQGRPSPHRLPL